VDLKRKQALPTVAKLVVTIALLAIFTILGCAPAPPYKIEPVVGKENYARIKVFFATDRNRRNTNQPSDIFGIDRGDLSYGTCEVSIPRAHRIGVLESPSIVKLEFREDPIRHVVLLDVSLQDKKKWVFSLVSG